MSINQQDRGENEFFMVWNPDGRAPTHRHYSAESARVEASRLARVAPGQSFYILQAVAKAEVPERPVRVTRLASGSDAEIPF